MYKLTCASESNARGRMARTACNCPDCWPPEKNVELSLRTAALTGTAVPSAKIHARLWGVASKDISTSAGVVKVCAASSGAASAGSVQKSPPKGSTCASPALVRKHKKLGAHLSDAEASCFPSLEARAAPARMRKRKGLGAHLSDADAPGFQSLEARPQWKIKL